MNQKTLQRLSKYSNWIFFIWALDFFFALCFVAIHSPLGTFFVQQLYFLLYPLFFIAIAFRLPWLWQEYKNSQNLFIQDKYHSAR